MMDKIILYHGTEADSSDLLNLDFQKENDSNL